MRHRRSCENCFLFSVSILADLRAAVFNQLVSDRKYAPVTDGDLPPLAIFIAQKTIGTTPRPRL
jgi:hypothetical protein